MPFNTEHIMSLLNILLPCEKRLPVPKVHFRLGTVLGLGDSPPASLSDGGTDYKGLGSPKKPMSREILCDIKLLHYK